MLYNPTRCLPVSSSLGLALGVSLSMMVDASNPGNATATSSIGWLLLSVMWSLAGVSVILLVLRLYTAARVVQRVKLEDYLMLLALVSSYQTFENDQY
jgi:hypothetical protein